MHIKPYTLQAQGDISIQCYNVTQSYPLSSTKDNITTCINYQSHHWYGGAEVYSRVPTE